MSKNVAVFVDVANIFYAAKAAGVDIDYVTLLKAATAGRDFIRAYAYTGLDPENENQRQFHGFLARNGYKVVSKDIRKYGDGKVKANLDIELVVDLMKTARNVDIAVVVSGDGDFAPAIRAVQEMGVRVEVISFRGNTSSDLIDVADTFMDITQLAKVEKTGRSGRRVAASGEDLSMTAVPDKETEGAPRRRRRSTKAAAEEAAPEAAPAPAVIGARPPAGRGRRAAPQVAASAARSAAEAIAAAGVAGLRVLPGERLSRVGAPPAEAIPENGAMTAGSEPLDSAALAEVAGEVAAGSAETVEAGSDGAEPVAQAGEIAIVSEGESGQEREGDGRRRRRRRGGRGRGRGRGRDREFTPLAETRFAPAGEPEEMGQELEDEGVSYAPVRPPQSTFGSVWDSQLGMNAPSRPAAEAPPVDEEDLEEPEIPEYLLAERRRGAQGQHQGGRGGRGRGGRGRGAYAAALDRERYGRSPGVTPGWGGDRGVRQGRGPRPGGRPMGGPGQVQVRPGGYERPVSAEPWSEVPPDLEEQIRAQLAATRPQPMNAPSGGAPGPQAVPAVEAQGIPEPIGGTVDAPAGGAQRGRGRPRKAADAPGAESAGTTAAPRTRARTPRKPATSGRTTRSASRTAETPEGAGETAAPKRRVRTRKAADETTET